MPFFLKYPFTTAMGAIFGILINGFIPNITNEYLKLEFPDFPIYLWILLGVFTFNLKNLLSPNNIPDKYDEVFQLINQAKRESNLSELEFNQYYRMLIQRAIKGTDFDNLSEGIEKTKEIEEIEKKISEANS
ncbi:hypothetical protein HRE53_30330 (plasmid) [Acaryochloris sp. 'Moss Beach']|uniref:hypothetical protein n=1 Tax=Acaryochloris sp. 'Moss Beach' TaxID=2740837 RepID=UPI001F38AD06|nr:hypothetical protein [Acaryochloris sp. 'Moss Beach']UJB73028.1 hypothetical protein HRE53_30330 [Acaryochloris sp. 'Moss Beach']